MDDPGLLDALVRRAEGHQPSAATLGVSRPDSVLAQRRRAAELAGLVWNFHDDCRPGLMTGDRLAVEQLTLPEGRRVRLFTASGAIDAAMVAPGAQPVLADDEKAADRRKAHDIMKSVARLLCPDGITQDRELRLESVWERKAQGQALRGDRSPVALVEVVAAFRRYIDDLPVLGRASIHVGVGGGYAVTRWGIDWRSHVARPIREVRIAPPEVGARRVIEMIQRRLSGRTPTLKDFAPERMVLGYVSASRREAQSRFEPNWVAILRPAGPLSMGMVLAVPASA